VLRADVEEVYVQPVDLGEKVWQIVEIGLAAPPIIVVTPIAGERPQSVELDALAVVSHEFLFWPTSRENAALHVHDIGVRNGDPIGPDRGTARTASTITGPKSEIGGIRCAHGDEPERPDTGRCGQEIT